MTEQERNRAVGAAIVWGFGIPVAILLVVLSAFLWHTAITYLVGYAVEAWHAAKAIWELLK